MLEHAYYSVISPEGCAAILWKTAEYKSHAAETLKLTASDLARFKTIDEVIPEPIGGAHRDHAQAEIENIDDDERVRRRYEKFKAMGVYAEGGSNRSVNSSAAPSP